MRVAERTLRCPGPLDVAWTFGPLVRGRHDPSSRILGGRLLHAMHSPAGVVTFSVEADAAAATVRMQAWGPGRDWVVERAEHVAGLSDRPERFVTGDTKVAALHRRARGLRLVRLGAVYDLALATTVEQRVTTAEARRSWGALLRRFGTPAPGVHRLVVAPAPEVVATMHDWQWRSIGIEGRRAATLQSIARDCSGLARAAECGDDALARRLRSLPGVGPWTLAHVLHMAVADADAVPVGDWHLPRHVGHALAGEPKADDARMLELLEPFRPHRARVWRLLVSATAAPRRRAPRARIHDLMRAEAARARR